MDMTKVVFVLRRSHESVDTNHFQVSAASISVLAHAYHSFCIVAHSSDSGTRQSWTSLFLFVLRR